MGPRLFYSNDTEQCEASPVDITCSRVDLYCLGDEYTIWASRTLTRVKHKVNRDKNKDKSSRDKNKVVKLVGNYKGVETI